ncbi:pimeloyl-ACP methyl ester carboxylesterase [Kribbella orskensis]|uniref:Pimeloyl-ACP methyl ester carboxylesterase n=1 Tax=Kribbella orskensis TaxID=2512216 RepID=A0ABY2BTY1_9ACTN|nr:MULTISPECIES: alpha/beta hydrolase [Kribbella]TCN44485.1 pimeloyl-ACP methyl ester carboxylesterase [Kribbella sp. VKM Ac-2500]TCO31737.1 pimeloyl-ACP methyl ester carboxylesterase [Kribbella orskensis]
MTIQADRTGVVTPDGVRLHVETSGSADAPVTVVLAHGWTCSTRSWHHQLEGLPRVVGSSAVRVVAYDHRGHGRSDAAPVGTTRIEQLADDLVTVLDEVVGDGPVVYAGHSMGGMTLMALADQHPELFGSRIAGAALVSTSCGRISSRAFGLPARFDGATAVVAPRAMNLAGERIERRALRRATRGSEAAVRAQRAAWVELASTRMRRPAVRQLVFGKKADPAEVDILMADLAHTPGRSFSGFFEAITRHELGHALKALEGIPVEIMHGTRDRLLPPRHGNRMAHELPSARLWMYPGAGHMLMQERPRDVTQRLASLVRRTAAA